MTYTLDYDFYIGSQNTGLTIHGQLLNTDRTTQGSEITTGIGEINNGHYLAHITTIPDDHRGAIKFYESGSPDTSLATFAINPEEGEYLGIVENSVTLKQWLRRIGAVLFGPVEDAGTTNPKFKDSTDTYERVSATVDTSGNRTAVSYDDT